MLKSYSEIWTIHRHVRECVVLQNEMRTVGTSCRGDNLSYMGMNSAVVLFRAFTIDIERQAWWRVDTIPGY